MSETKREGSILKIGDTIRIEPGPMLKSSVATESLLSNSVTAAHYQASRPATEAEIADPGIATTPDGTRIFVDARNKPIMLGEEMKYLDWNGHAAAVDGSTVFYVTAYEPMTSAERKERETTDADLKGIEAKRGSLLSADEREAMTMIWHTIGETATEEKAITLATDYLVKQAGA